MNRDDIIRMAREARLVNQPAPGVIWSCPIPSDDYPDRIERFAALVAAAEREACAKVCEEVGNRDAETHAWDAADAIRARGEP